MTLYENDLNSTIPQISRSKNNRKLIISILVIILILLAAGSFVAYAKFDVFKSPKMIYIESELKNLSGAHESLSRVLNTYKEEVQPLLDKPVHSIFELSDVTIDADQQDEQNKKLIDFIKKSKLVFDIQQDAKTHQSLSQFNWHVGSDPLIGVEASFDKEKLAIRIPALYKKYGFVKVSDMDALKKEFNSDKLPKKILTYNDIVSAVKITPEELAPVLVTYGKLYMDNIDAKQISLNKNGMLEEENARIPSRELTLTFSENDVKRMVRSMTDKLESDKTLQDLVYTRFKNVRQLLNDSGYPTKDMDKDDFSDEWKRYCDQLKESTDNAEFSNGMTMILYIDGKDRILERKLSFNMKESGGGTNAVTIKSANWQDKDFPSNVLFSFKTKSDKGDGGEFKILHSSNSSAGGSKGKLGVNVKEYGGNQSDSVFLLDADYDVKKNQDKDTGTYNFKLSIPEKGMNGGTVKGNVTETTVKSTNAKDSSYGVKLSFSEMKNENQVKGISFKLHNKQETLAEIKLPELNKDNSFDLAHMSDDDRFQLFQDLGTGVQEFMAKNNNLLQSLGIPYGNMVQPPDSYGTDTN